MATITTGHNAPTGFSSGETVTATKLNNHVNSATVTNIVNADISASADIAGSKLADSAVTTAKINNAAVTAAKLDGAQTGSAPIYGCRAWVNFDGTRNEADTGASTNGANVKIRASGNVASVLKNAVGDYTVTFTTAMPDANYATSLSTTADGYAPHIYLETSPLAGSVRVSVTRDLGTSINTHDKTNVSVVIIR